MIRLKVVVVTLCAAALGLYVVLALPPRGIVIEAGPVGGTYHAHARAYAEVLAEHGFTTELRANPNSAEIIDNVNAPDSGVDIGFVAQPVDPAATPRVRSLAKVELQPLFMFHSIALGELVSPVNLRGRRVIMPPEGSATAVAARALLTLYGVTPQTATIEHAEITEAARRLTDGEADAGFFMLAAENPLIHTLARDRDLAAFSYGDARSITINLDYLSTTMLPAGGFDLSQSLPPGNLDLVGAEVNVITHTDLHPALAFAMLDALERRHQSATAIARMGQYPDIVGTRLPLLPEARDYTQSGRPWSYRLFGTYWGSLIDEFSVAIFALFVITQGYRTIKYMLEALTLVGLWLAGGLIERQIRAHAQGRNPGRLEMLLMALSAGLINRVSVSGRARAKLEDWRRLTAGAAR
ncbi:TRAP-type uncharacterized transport system, substrate-binding protein [Roseovarius litoreus]|uniref:TRAP-type uncharacterized transport system, substrate-binding protein n=1 Tax=Roseovarius litoreus TaxID=1155722 RepID=A0A1M7EGR7_9RHOB|nr:TAXI family TRAP transporter solute-binding subunit [Roseovarius litoreus]SHL90828.1 TRAP-type uncharacterized transport system, substrate-binding protein [Roseovarius litoreus]